MMHEFNGEEFIEEFVPVSNGMMNAIEQMYGRVVLAIPKNKKVTIDTWLSSLHTLSEKDGFELFMLLKSYDAGEPVSLTEINNHLKKFT
jgi:hypothetical protein